MSKKLYLIMLVSMTVYRLTIFSFSTFINFHNNLLAIDDTKLWAPEFCLHNKMMRSFYHFIKLMFRCNNTKVWKVCCEYRALWVRVSWNMTWDYHATWYRKKLSVCTHSWKASFNVMNLILIDVSQINLSNSEIQRSIPMKSRDLFKKWWCTFLKGTRY